ncbi:MAG: ABC transporter substrate-binding protein [Candidatus Aenigmarchaeota archaeon]|nr:ABC transporter substrate-binding protein [Candidatus Aenigmarchaeota archaeon]
MIGFIPNVGYAPFYVAATNGYYDEEGLDVSFQYAPEGDIGVVKQLGANTVEFGYAGDHAVIIGRTQDVPILSIQRIIQENLFGIYSKETFGTDEPYDLVGKKIAISGPGSTPATITKIMLKKSAINTTQVEFLYVGGAVISTHLTGESDVFATYLPMKVVAEGIAGEQMNEISGSEYTTIGRTYVITTERMINEHPDIVRKFVRATQKGMEYSVEHPEEAVDAFIKFNPDAIEKKQLHLSIWKAMVERGFDKDTNGNPIFYLPSEDNWAEKQDQMFDIGIMDKKTPIEEMYTDEFISN